MLIFGGRGAKSLEIDLEIQTLNGITGTWI